MRICSVAHALPSRLIRNEELIDRIVFESRRHLSPEDLHVLRRSLTALFRKVGAVTRYHRAEGERAIDYGVVAARRALAAANLTPKNIDLLIYAGVTRGFLEPSTASVFQDAIGLSNATCFDILDACASWLRALDVAHHMLGRAADRNVMILNCEFNVHEYGSPAVESLEALKHLEAGFTIGEAATATIVSGSVEDCSYYATFRSFGEFSALCQIPLPNALQFQSDGRRSYAPLRFFAHALELNARVVRALEQHYWSDERLWKSKPDIIFGHSAGLAATKNVARKLKLDVSSHYEIFPQYGNTASASLPLAMSLAFQEQALQRGRRVLLIMGSAGITTGFCTFNF